MSRSLRGSSFPRRTPSSRSNFKLALSSAASLVVASLSSQKGLAATGTWFQPFGGTYDFGTPANWINGGVPSSVDDIADFSRFNFQGGDISVTLNSNRTIGQLLVGDLDISSAINFVFSGTGSLTLATSVGQPTINVAQQGVFGQITRIDNAIAGTSGFNKIGIGVLALNGVNTYTGPTTITAGTVRIGSAANIGASTVVLNGGTLDLRNNVSTNFGANVTLSANSQINVDDVDGAGITSQVHTIGALNFGSAGLARTLTVTNYQPITTPTPTPDNNFFSLATGLVTLNDSATLLSDLNGTIGLGGINSAAASAATFTISGSAGYAGNITVTGPVTQGAGPLAITFNSNRTLILAGALSHTGGTNITGGGLVQLAPGITMPATGPVTITNGTLDLNNNSSTIGVLTMGGNNGTLLTESGTLTFGNDIFFTGGTGTANLLGNFNFGATPHTFNITQGTSGQPEMVINGPTGDSGGGFIKAGNGTLRLTANSTATGAERIDAGTLQADALASGSSLGSGTLNITGGALHFVNVSNGASGTAGTLAFATNNSSGTLVLDSQGQVRRR